jgi:hypothetical protein
VHHRSLPYLFTNLIYCHSSEKILAIYSLCTETYSITAIILLCIWYKTICFQTFQSQFLFENWLTLSRGGGVIVCLFVCSFIGGSSPDRVKPDYKICISRFYANHAAIRRKSKDWLARNQDNVFPRGLLFQRTSTIKIIGVNEWLFLKFTQQFLSYIMAWTS